MGHAPRGAQGRGRHDGGHQLVGVQAAFHDALYLLGGGHLRGARRCSMAVGHGFQGDAIQIEFQLFRQLTHAVLGANQHRVHEALVGGLQRTLE